MTRSTFQKGYIFTRLTKRGKVHVIRYRVRSADGKWRHKAETVNSPRRKDAERILAERLREVNRGLRLPVEIIFADFAASHWETYISQNLKPSTQASHRSNIKAHFLIEAEVCPEPVRTLAGDAQPRCFLGTLELESDPTGS